jgi:fructokinase
MLEIVVVGDANVDLIATVQSYPERGGCITCDTFEKFPGGSGANFAIGASLLGAHVGLMSKVGKDKHGQFLLKTLKNFNVDASHILISRERPTGVVLAIVDKEGERTFFSLRKGCADIYLREDEVDKKYIKRSKLLHLSGVLLVESPESPISFSLRAMKLARAFNITTSFDPNLRLTTNRLPAWAKDLLEKSLSLSDIVLLNEEEASIISEGKINEWAKKLLRQDTKIVCIKMGGRGCMVYTRNKKMVCPAFKVKPVDTTGAGDAFNAAFDVGYLRGWNVKKVAMFANAVGAMTVTKRGAIPSYPKIEEVIKFLKW